MPSEAAAEAERKGAAKFSTAAARIKPPRLPRKLCLLDEPVGPGPRETMRPVMKPRAVRGRSGRECADTSREGLFLGETMPAARRDGGSKPTWVGRGEASRCLYLYLVKTSARKRHRTGPYCAGQGKVAPGQVTRPQGRQKDGRRGKLPRLRGSSAAKLPRTTMAHRASQARQHPLPHGAAGAFDGSNGAESYRLATTGLLTDLPGMKRGMRRSRVTLSD